MTDPAFDTLKMLMQEYVNSAENKLKALNDISHISYVLHHEYEHEVENERSNSAVVADWDC